LDDVYDLKWKYKITHIVNATGVPFSMQDSFIVMDINIKELNNFSFGQSCTSVIGFYRSAIIRNGRVLI